MSKLGQYLKNERERRGLSLHEIGLSLKINPKILAALEEGQKENLPAKTFLRGFVRSYAQYLRLNADQAQQFFLEEYGQARVEGPIGEANVSQPPTPHMEPLRTPSVDEPRRNQEQSRLLLIGGGILFFILVVFVAKMVDKYQKERATRPLPLPTVESTNEVPPANGMMSVSPTPSTTPTLPPSLTPTPMPTPMETPTPAPVASPTSTAAPAVVPPAPTATATPSAPTPATPKPTPLPKATPALNPTLTPTPMPTPKATPAPTPTATPAATSTTTSNAEATPSPTPLTRPTEVIIETLNSVTVKFSLSEGKSGTLNLAASQLHTLRSKGSVTLEISDGGVVNLIVNGRDRGIPGKVGQRIKLTLP